MSDFIWQSWLIREKYGSKENLLNYMETAAQDDSDDHNHSQTDYNYRMQAPGKAHFKMLRIEAQAKLVEDYFYLTRGRDPRTIKSGSDYRPRPKMAFYKMMIPFLPGKQAICD